MKLIAVSGGVDSMLLVNTYKDKKDIIVAYINYNVRGDTHIDEEVVTQFCKSNHIKLKKLILKGNECEGNFENWARNIRYNFFKEIYDKYNCSELLIAHHKDDFLETCLMQEEKNKNKLFYGIKKNTSYMGMKIYRPFLHKYWKSEIYDLANKLNIKYHDDYTNFDSKYRRNYYRNNVINLMSNEEKNKLYNDFVKRNKGNENVVKEIKILYSQWSKKNFNIHYFNDLDYKNELIKMFVNKRVDGANLNSKIIGNILLFLKANKKPIFVLNDGYKLVKKNQKILIEKER